jgi:ribonuclease Z
MKTSFLPRLVNGQTGDPVLFVDILREKRALLFDCGTLTNLSPSEILRVTDVFVTHTHIDHFVGFDHLLRIHMGRGKRVRVYGPKGIIGCVRGKLSGYTWNLVRRQRLVFEVREWDGQGLRSCEFWCRNHFRQGGMRYTEESSCLFEDEIIQVRATILDHKIPSLGFTVTERDFYNVDPVRLEAMGKRPGPWLNELKRWARRSGTHMGADPDGSIVVEGEQMNAAELTERLLIVTPGRTLAYVADVRGSRDNQQKIIDLTRGAEVLFCEGAFLHEDKERADQTYHLTAREAGELARRAEVGRLVVFHFSPKYEGRFDELEREALRAQGGEPEP